MKSRKLDPCAHLGEIWHMAWAALTLQSGDVRAVHAPDLCIVSAIMLQEEAWSCAEIRFAKFVLKFPHHCIVQATTGYIWIADLVGAIHSIFALKELVTSPFIEKLPR